MKKLITNWRYWVAGAVFCAGLVALLSEPAGANNWLVTLLLSKAAGIALCAAALALFVAWVKAGKIDLTDFTEE